MEKNREKLKNQLIDLYDRVVYAYTTQFKTQKRIEKISASCKVLQIILAAIATGGFLATIITKQYIMSWIGGLASVLSLGLSLYIKENSINLMCFHKEATDELWDVKEEYLSLITDFDDLSIDEIRNKRDKIQEKWSLINKRHRTIGKKKLSASKSELENTNELLIKSAEEVASLPLNQIEKAVYLAKNESDKENDAVKEETIIEKTIDEIPVNEITLDENRISDLNDEQEMEIVETVDEVLADIPQQETNLETERIGQQIDAAIEETNQKQNEKLNNDVNNDLNNYVQMEVNSETEDIVEDNETIAADEEKSLSELYDSIEELKKTENLKIDTILETFADNQPAHIEDEQFVQDFVEEIDDEDLSPEQFLEKNIERYPGISKNKIMSITKHVNKMMESVSDSDAFSLQHFIKFKNVDSKLKYEAIATVEGYSIENSDNNELELFVYNTIEANAIVLTKSILQLAQDVTEYNGSYHGWALKD